MSEIRRSNKSRMQIPASTTGEFLLSVYQSDTCCLVVGNPGGSTFDVIAYIFNDSEDNQDGLTKVQAKIEEGKTSTNLVRTISAPVSKVGINVTSATGSPINIEVSYLGR